MQRVTVAETLKILIVTEDRALARHLSQFLSAVGYQVLQAAEPDSALAAVDAERPHVAILGADLASQADWEICGQLARLESSAGLFKFLLVEEPDPEQLREALEAGIDDVLVAPVDFGELLSRLRSAARVLEYDYRIAQQGHVEPVTGMASRSALIAHLRQLLIARKGKSPRLSCVVLEIDYFGRIQHAQGRAAGNALVERVAAELENLRSGAEIFGCHGQGRFCAILPETNDKSAFEWAERARRALAALKFKHGETTWQITASLGVAACDAAESAEQLIERAVEALQTAQASGRNCVVRWGEFGDSPEPAGKLFDRTLARDVMTHCGVFLRPSESLGEAVALFERTRLEAVPVVDGDGSLVGLCEEERLTSVPESEYATRTVRDFVTGDVQSFGDDEKLTSLLEFFTRDPRSLVVVLNKSRPVGFVTCNSLAALSQPVSQNGLREEAKYSDKSDYLLVPDLRPLECAAAV